MDEPKTFKQITATYSIFCDCGLHGTASGPEQHSARGTASWARKTGWMKVKGRWICPKCRGLEWARFESGF